MDEEDLSQEFRFNLIIIKEMHNLFIKEIGQNELFNNKNKKVCRTLNYLKHFLTLVFALAVCISISDFASLFDISKGILSSTIGLNISAMFARIKKYKLITKNIKENHDEKSLYQKLI